MRVLVERIGRSSLTFRVEGMLADGAPRFTGSLTISFISPAVMKSVPIPSEIAERVRTYQAACMAAGKETRAQGDATCHADRSSATIA